MKPVGAVLAVGLVFTACVADDDATSVPSPSTVVAESDPPDVPEPTVASEPALSGAPEPAVPSCGGEVEEVETFAYREVDGVDSDLVSLDVYSPADAARCPVVLWVHGGAWMAGDKRTRSTLVKADHFVRDGYVFVSVNYRLASKDNDVRWPDFGSDVAAATAWVIDNAAAIGVDPDRVGLLGHSAGGHLVSINATNPDLLGEFGLDRDEVACVAALDSASLDTAMPFDFQLPALDVAFGPSEAARADGSPIVQTREHASDGPVPEFFLAVRGARGRYDITEAFEEALVDVGAAATVFDAAPYTHAEVSVELGVPGEDLITPPVTDFFADCLG